MRVKRKKAAGGICLAMLSVLSSLYPLPAQAAADSSAFIESIEAAYAEPEMRYRPYARWWLAEGSHTDQTLLESVNELYQAGYGGAEIVTLDESRYLDSKTFAWGSDEWIHDTRVIMEECQRLGMSVSMTSGTHWATANLISITPDEEAASQELGYQTVALVSDGSGDLPCYKGELPLCSLPNNVKKQSLVKVLAVKVTERGSGRMARGIAAPTRIDLASLEDITGQAVYDEATGTYSIDYTASDEGDYDLMVFYQYGTGEAYSPAVSKSYTINYLSTEGANALIDYWDKNVLTEEMQSLISQMDECSLYMDSLELSVHGSDTTGLLWCEDMLEQFEGRNTYSIDRMLPLLIKSGGSFGSQISYYYEPADEADQEYADNLRLDFMQTQTQLYTENCLKVLQEWLHSRHMKLRAENSYGAPFEISEPVVALDYVETESMEFGNEIDSHRNMAGAAHLLGKRMSSETGAWVSSNYVYDNQYYMQIFYMQFAAGVQKTVTHGYSSEYGPEECVQWPGYEGMDEVWSERFNKRQPASIDYPEENLHISRLQKALEEGVPQMDIAILRTDYAFNNSLVNGGLMNFVKEGVYSNKAHTQDAWYWRDMELQNAGYTYDYFSPRLLTDQAVSCTDGVINSDGVAYQALILMEDELPLEAAEKILAWAQDGLPVLFVDHVDEIVAGTDILKENTQAGSITGSNNASKEELAEVVDKIKDLPNVRTVDGTADACEALQELGVHPRVEYANANTKLLPVLRSTEETDYLYLYHYMYEDSEGIETDISLDGIYEPYVLDTWSGSVVPAENYRVEDGRTVIHVNISPGETMLLALNKNNGLSEGMKAETVYEEEEQLLDGWTLVLDSFEPGELVTRTETNEETGVTVTEAAYTTEHVELAVGKVDELLSWKDLDTAYAEVSGIGTYTTVFNIEEVILAKAERVIFQADSFEGGTAAVWINGEKVPVNMERHTADITEYLVSGENTLQVRVTSSLRNRMIEVGYEQGWNMLQPEPADYGMTGETKIIFQSRK